MGGINFNQIAALDPVFAIPSFCFFLPLQQFFGGIRHGHRISHKPFLVKESLFAGFDMVSIFCGSRRASVRLGFFVCRSTFDGFLGRTSSTLLILRIDVNRPKYTLISSFSTCASSTSGSNAGAFFTNADGYPSFVMLPSSVI